MRDVAYVHEGSPPQTNLVRVNGSRAVLMTILKAGAASTLNVIDGIKSLLPRVEESLPAGLNVRAVGDQSIFVKAAIFGVLREAVLAAGLVGLMILLFLGSWRSTMIIIVSIPLSILFSVIAIAALGETINVMTLGGLALAVGMLVDEGTVTLENIFFHLEQGKDGRTGHPRRRAADRRARVRHIACARHRVRADVPARRRSGLLVPAAGRGGRVRADRLLRAVTDLGADDGAILPSRPHRASGWSCGIHVKHSRNPLKRFQMGFERVFTLFRSRYRALLLIALGNPKTVIAGFIVIVICSFGLWPFLGENFFPAVDSGQILMHVRAQPGTRIEETARLFDLIEQTVRAASSRPNNSTTSSTISDCHFPASTWPTRTPERSARRTATP